MSSEYAMKALFFISILFLFFLFLRFIEKKNLYFPLREIEATPQNIGIAYEDINLTTKDGIQITGWFIPSEKARATFLFFHGNGGNISHRLEKIKMLNVLNVNVFIFDYRGYGESSGSPSENGLYADAEAAYDLLVNKRKIAPPRIIAYGESLGGAVAVYLAGKREVGGIIMESTFTSVRDMAKRLLPFFPRFLLKSRFDSLEKIKEIGVPKLILHSRDDEIVPLELGNMLYREAAGPKEFVELRGGHNDAFLISQEIFTSAIDSFITRVGVSKK
jgi:fermentation-respiration switch protein FrsA (DUF1100 family)